MGYSRQSTERGIESLYRQLDDVLVYMNTLILDNERAEIKTRLERLLVLFNDSEYREGISRLNDNGLKQYHLYLKELYLKMTMGKSAEFYYNNIPENLSFHVRPEQGLATSDYEIFNARSPIDNLWPDIASNPIGGLINFFDRLGDVSARLLNMIQAAGNGDQSARTHLDFIWHKARRDTLITLSNNSTTATFVFLAYGAVPLAKISSAVGLVADIALTFDDFISGNHIDGFVSAGFVVAGLLLNSGATTGVNAIIERGIRINRGRNGLFYSKGRRGALKTRDAITRLIRADIAAGKLGEITPIVAGEIIDMAGLAYEALSDNEE